MPTSTTTNRDEDSTKLDKNLLLSIHGKYNYFLDVLKDLGISEDEPLFWCSEASYEDENFGISYKNYYSPSSHAIIADDNTREVKRRDPEARDQGLHWSGVVFPTWIETCKKEVEKVDSTLVQADLIRGLKWIIRAYLINEKTLNLIDEFMPVDDKLKQQQETFTPTKNSGGFYGTS